MLPSQTHDRKILRLDCAIALMLLVSLVACDGIDVQNLASVSDLASEARTALADSPSRAASLEPDMESIGPDGALRIYYQFIDDSGAVQFVERLSDVPVAWRDRVGYLETRQSPPLTPAEARKSWTLSAKRSAQIVLAAESALAPEVDPQHKRMDDFKNDSGSVILYAATWCGYCTKARQHLDGEGIQYEVRDVDIQAVSQELREKTGRGGIPVLDFGGEILRGYSADQYDRAIRSIKG